MGHKLPTIYKLQPGPRCFTCPRWAAGRVERTRGVGVWGLAWVF